jgi:hypothetical protein
MPEPEFDVAVIGGGPAGLMAAGTAAREGATVVLIEKNSRPGKKLLITGKGRCNITSGDVDNRSFLENFGDRGKYFFSALHAFSAEDAVAFFEEHGVPVKIERGNRVFPSSDRAMDVRDALVRYCKSAGVVFATGSAVKKIAHEGSRITSVAAGQRTFTARNYILCTGGMSYPATGSTGDGYRFARDLGHTIISPRPALVPLIVSEPWVNRLEGLSLKNVKAVLSMPGRKKIERFGEALFTSRGMSGPIILDLSRELSSGLPGGTTLSIDLKPALGIEELDARILRDFGHQPNRQFKNGLGELLPASLIPVIVDLSGIDPGKKLNAVTRVERRSLAELLKNLRMTVTGTEGFDQAIITAGGVSLDEIDLRSMRSRLVENLFFAGEVMDIDGPTGGFNLQICWSTGFCAGKAAAG